MRICPTEEEIVLFADGVAGDGPRECGDVDEHLAECAECRRLLATSEAALRLALGGRADGEAVPAAPTGGRIRRWPLAAAAAACVAAVAVVAAVVASVAGTQVPASPADPRGTGEPASGPPGRAPVRAEIASLAERVSAAERDHAAPEAAHDDAAAAALAAADVRDALGMPGAADRWRHVAERFAGTHEAVEARARLAAVSAGEDRR